MMKDSFSNALVCSTLVSLESRTPAHGTSIKVFDQTLKQAMERSQYGELKSDSKTKRTVLGKPLFDK